MKDPRYPPKDHGEVGIMTAEHTVWCGHCRRWNQFPGSKREVTTAAKKSGWVFKQDRGWTCSFCAAKGRQIEKQPVTHAR